jgi:hypothetical protein
LLMHQKPTTTHGTASGLRRERGSKDSVFVP